MSEIHPGTTADIVKHMEQTLGLAPNVAQFHAYDEHQQPLPDQLTATQYAEWLFKTNAQRSPEELKNLATRYRDAFTSQRTAIGITPGQLAHLYIAGEVLNVLLQQGGVTAPAPIVMPTPTPIPTPGPTIKITKTETPKPQAQTSAQQAVESQKDLEMLRAQLMSELDIKETNTALSAKDLERIVNDHVTAKTKELNALVNQGILTENERDAKLQQARREHARRSIELQSIDARMHLQQSTPTASLSAPTSPLMPGDHAAVIETLHKQEKEVLDEMDAMEKILDSAGLPPEELKHIRHQLNAVEELMKDIQEETH
jgi:hypothetical protein